MTWIIISSCLYLIGMYPVHYMLKLDKTDLLEEADKNWITAFWPIFFLIKICCHLIRRNPKEAAIILLVALCSCNMGERTDPDESQQLHLDNEKRIKIIPLQNASFAIKKKWQTNDNREVLIDDDGPTHPAVTIYSPYKKEKDTIFPQSNFNSLLIDSGTVLFDIFIGGRGIKGKYPAAYKKRDSAWVINDTAETLKQLLQWVERESFYDRHYIKRYTLKDTTRITPPTKAHY